MAASNYDDACSQLRSIGLLPRDGVFVIGKLQRCRVEGEREARGWYHLHEISKSDGSLLIVGAFGVWRGNVNNAQRIEIGKTELSADELDAMRKRLAEDRRKADQARQADADRAAQRAAYAWSKALPTGTSEYLVQKGVGGHGVRYSADGVLVIPMCDVRGSVRGLQIIRSHAQASKLRKLAKEFWPKGHMMGGTFHTLGMLTPGCVALIAEGYATAATAHEASGLPVVVAWAAGNLGKVADILRKRYAGIRLLLLADDDDLTTCPVDTCAAKFQLITAPLTCPSCGATHKRKNAGVDACSAAAITVDGGWLAPTWPDPGERWLRYIEHGSKATDFNDLAQDPSGGRTLVSQQIAAKLEELRWTAAPSAPSATSGGGDDGSDELRPIDSLDELLTRFALVYGAGGTVFDAHEHCLLPISDMRDACVRRELHRVWAEHPKRRIVRKHDVDFDPSEKDPRVLCNLWGGWPTVPVKGNCIKLLDLLLHMCSDEGHPDDPARLKLYQWILCWLAYPIQHPGTKLNTTVVMHGPQGTGKNLFFEAVMEIYGRYGGVIDQTSIEDKFNDWASRRLFLIADEVVARSDLFHVKNKLKAFITGKLIRINSKNVAAWDETNHVNLVFLSNEAMPVVLEEDDRRHAIVWTPAKLSKEFYGEVLAEIRNGGVAALHEYLLTIPLGDFEPGTLPPDTEAKRHLIDLSLDSTQRFYYELRRGEVGNVLVQPCLSADLYMLYRTWCHRTGARAAPMPKLLDALRRRHKAEKRRAIYLDLTGSKVQGSLVMLGGIQCPPGETETLWLGEQVRAFGAAARDYAKEEPR